MSFSKQNFCPISRSFQYFLIHLLSHSFMTISHLRFSSQRFNVSSSIVLSANDLASYFTKRTSYMFLLAQHRIIPPTCCLCSRSLLFSCDPSLLVIICVLKVCTLQSPSICALLLLTQWYHCITLPSISPPHQLLLLIGSFLLAYKHGIFFPVI